MISSSVYRPIIKLEKEEPSMKDLSVNHKAMMLSLTPTSKAFTGSQADGQVSVSVFHDCALLKETVILCFCFFHDCTL